MQPFAFQSAPTVATSIWEQQGSAIVGDAAGDSLGNSVALSADAKTLVAGAPYSDDREGYVKVYRMTDDGGGTWTQLGQTIYGNATRDGFGSFVDVTPEGNIILVGSPGYFWNNDQPGYVQVFSFLNGDTGTWEQVGQDIAGEAIGDEFGYSVSISDDGETIAVGARTNDGKNGMDLGRVRIYRLADDGASWDQSGQDIDGNAADDWSGRLVSLSVNGSIVAIGAPGVAGIYGDSRTGQVKVYRIDGGGLSWEQLGESIYGDNEYDEFGNSVDISPDGNSLAVGTDVYVGPGYAKVFSLENGGDDLGAADWKQVGLTITGEANGDQFGMSVSLWDDAQTLAVGAPGANGKDGDDVGRVSIYRMEDSKLVWKQIGEDIDGEAANDNSGWSVSLSANRTTVAIGCHENDDNGDGSGQVRVFAME